MSFFITDAYAAAQTAADTATQHPQGSGIQMILMFALIIGVFYFLMIRPQAKRQKEHKQLMDALTTGDEVVTNGGILGKINGVEDNFVILEIAKGVEIRIQKPAIMANLPKGTIKS